MNRLAQSIIAGGLVAAVAGMIMRRSPRNTNMMNRVANTMVNVMGSLGLFRLIGRTRFFRDMVR